MMNNESCNHESWMKATLILGLNLLAAQKVSRPFSTWISKEWDDTSIILSENGMSRHFII